MHPQVEKLISKEYAEQRSEEWLQLRGKMLTASDAATAIGDNPYEKPEGLILKKCGYNKFTGNAATEHGNKYEDEARILYEERHNEKCHEIGLYPHPTIKWLGGSPDGVTESGKLVEIKCPLKRQIKDEVPVHYLPQLQLLMEILDLESCDFIQYKPYDLTWPEKPEFVVTHVTRDRQWFEDKLPIMDALWKRVVWYRENGGVEELLPKPRKPRQTKKTVDATEPASCIIQSTYPDDWYRDDEDEDPPPPPPKCLIVVDDEDENYNL
jgi:putative phage-type endonuclease